MAEHVYMVMWKSTLVLFATVNHIGCAVMGLSHDDVSVCLPIPIAGVIIQWSYLACMGKISNKSAHAHNSLFTMWLSATCDGKFICGGGGGGI